MSHFDYGSGPERCAMDKYRSLARRAPTVQGKAMIAWRDACAKMVNYHALAQALSSPAFGHDKDLAALAELALAAIPKERRDAVLGECLDSAIQRNSAEAISWLVGKGAGQKSPMAHGARISGYSSFGDEGSWAVKFESWSGLAAQQGLKALQALEDSGVAASERSGVFVKLAKRAAAAGETYYEFHPWVCLMSSIPDEVDGRSAKEDRERIASLAKLWEPRGEELAACKRALFHLVQRSWSISAAKTLADLKVPMDEEMGAAAFEVLLTSMRSAAGHADRGAVRQAASFCVELSKWLSVGGGPKGQAVFDALAENLEKGLSKGPKEEACEHAVALVDFSKLAKRVKGWAKVSPQAARGLSDRISVHLASQSQSASKSSRGVELAQWVGDAMEALDELSKDLAPKKTATKRI